jgi:hypothetical protein
MSATNLRSWHYVLALIAIAVIALESRGSAFVRGAYYRLGENDPGAAGGAVGNDPTIDSFTDALNLGRFGSPRYSANVPQKYAASKLSMSFANIGLGGPTVLGYYGRTTPLPAVDQGYALEAWVNTPDVSVVLDPPTSPHLVAYNGTPGLNGFGFYESGGNYVARIGATDHPLGPTGGATWHHLAFVQSFADASYYYDGKLISSTSTDPLPLAPTGGFWLGGRQSGVDNLDLFNGYVDEVRYQSFNPLAAGAFEPTAFLIDAPDPSQLALVGVTAVYGLTLRRRRRPRTAR